MSNDAPYDENEPHNDDDGAFGDVEDDDAFDASDEHP